MISPFYMREKRETCRRTYKAQRKNEIMPEAGARFGKCDVVYCDNGVEGLSARCAAWALLPCVHVLALNLAAFLPFTSHPRAVSHTTRSENVNKWKRSLCREEELLELVLRYV